MLCMDWREEHLNCEKGGEGWRGILRPSRWEKSAWIGKQRGPTTTFATGEEKPYSFSRHFLYTYVKCIAAGTSLNGHISVNFVMESDWISLTVRSFRHNFNFNCRKPWCVKSLSSLSSSLHPRSFQRNTALPFYHGSLSSLCLTTTPDLAQGLRCLRGWIVAHKRGRYHTHNRSTVIKNSTTNLHFFAPNSQRRRKPQSSPFVFNIPTKVTR